MNHPYGPWATLISAGQNPQLSAFWRRRMVMLVHVSQTKPSLSRRSAVALVAAALGIFLLPTFRAAPATAQQRQPAKEDGLKRAESDGNHAPGGPAALEVNLRRAKSCKATMITDIPFVREAGKPPVTAEMTTTLYWLAPKSYRMETKGNQFAPEQDATDIFPAGKPAIHLDNKAKTFRQDPAPRTQQPTFLMLDALSNFSAKADRDLGAKEIKGKQAVGFEIDGKKIDPDAYPGPVEVWLDAKSHLPVALRYEMRSPVMPAPMVMRMEDFQWNIDLPGSLFEAKAPAGYVDQGKGEVEYPGPEKTLKGIINALKTYAEVCGGHYPRIAHTFAEPVRDEMFKAAKVAYPARTIEEMRDKTYQKVFDASQGFAVFNRVMMYNPDVAYYGNIVGPKDKDEVLLRWKLDDGRYAVIYGDLRSETVTAERLKKLEQPKVDKSGVIRVHGRPIGMWGIDAPIAR